ncbi:MAG: prepilin peptidase [Acidobacteriota bacterium]
MHSFAWWPTLIVVAIATATDLRSRRIPNWLVFPFFAAGVGISVWMRGWHGFGNSLEGAALGLLLYGALFWVGGMGAGDVKLCTAIGAWIGPQQLFLALVFAALIGGAMAVVWAVSGGFFTELLQGTGLLLLGKGRRAADSPASAETQPERRRFLRRHMPYAPAIAAGTLLSFFAR